MFFFLTHRDRKRKRFVKESGKEEQNKKIRTESGQIVHNKKRKNLYPFTTVSICERVVSVLTFHLFSCIIVMLCHLTTFQLRGMEEEI